MTIIPAYGRDYTSAKAVLADWTANKDFQIADSSSIWNGAYVSRNQLASTHLVIIQYNQFSQSVQSTGARNNPYDELTLAVRDTSYLRQ